MSDAAGERLRLFVGARVAIATANALAGAAETLARRAKDAGLDVRWVAPANYHVTLRFLGWTRREAVGALRDALAAAAAGTGPLSFETARLGAFPALDRANVVWAGVEGAAALVQLAGRIDAACVQLGFAAGTQPFHPHVTLGRLREARAVRGVVLPLAEQMFGGTRIESITLFESETKSSGSVYREHSKIDLKSPSKQPNSPSERQTSPVEQGRNNPFREPPNTDDTDDGWPRGRSIPPGPPAPHEE